MYNTIDVQSFAGGFTLGMAQANFNLVGKREQKGGFGVANCEANRHLIPGNWQSEAVHPSEWTVPTNTDIQVVHSNPPCSGWSVMSSKSFRGADSPVNSCMWATVEFAARVNPQVVVFESVQLAVREGEGRDLMRALRADLENRTGEQWHLYHIKHNAYSVGGPAMRKRYFWLASKIPFGIEEPGITRYPTLNEVIGDLVEQPLTWDAQPYAQPDGSWWSESRRNHGEHGVPAFTVDGHQKNHSPLHTRVSELIEWSGMKPRESIQNALRRCYETHGSLPPSWKPNEAKFVKNDFFHGFTAPCRWDGDFPTRVITGAALGTVIHPTLDRTITHREAARMMGFPDDWLIDPIKNIGGLAMTWGKGITVDCGRWIGEWIKNALDGNPGSYTGEVIGERENMIDCTNTWQTDGKFSTKRSTIVRAPKISRNSGGNMSDENVENPTEDAASASGRRGRPRSGVTLERDTLVLKMIDEHGSVTKKQVAEATGMKPSEAYLTLFRLRKQGLVARGAQGTSHSWTRVAVVESDIEQPADVPADGAVEAEQPTDEANAEPVYGITPEG